MKRTFLFSSLAFVLAIGTAIGTRHFATGYSKKADVAGQTADCQARMLCIGTTVICQVALPSPPVTVVLYEAPTGSCGLALSQD
jgi:hypothetical protein